MTDIGLRGLRARLSPWHPWVIAAAIDRAASLITSGDSQQGRELDRFAYEESREGLSADHPCAEAAGRDWSYGLRGPDERDVSHRRVVEIDIPQT